MSVYLLARRYFRPYHRCLRCSDAVATFLVLLQPAGTAAAAATVAVAAAAAFKLTVIFRWWFLSLRVNPANAIC